MLLTLEDFPPSWIHEPDDPSDDAAPAPNPLESCLEDEFPGRTGQAIGGEFSDENTTRLSINPTVYVFDSPENAQAAVDLLVGRVQCTADVIGDGFDVTDTIALGEAYTEPLAAADFDATAAIRVYQTLIDKSVDPPASDLLVFDVVVIVEGRVLSEVDGFQRFMPIDQGLLKTYVDKARLKIPSAAFA